MANYSRIVYLVLLITVTVFFICGCGTAELSEGEPVDKELPGEVEIEAPDAEIPEISLLAVGDVMLARKLDRLIREKGMDYPFLMTREILSEADIAFANLESPYPIRGKT